MTKKYYVGNLPWSATEDDVEELFSQNGNVISVKLINDRETGRPRGFGFVEIENPEGVLDLNGKDFQGRELRINDAIDKK